MSSEAYPEGPAEADAGVVDRTPLRSLLFVPGTRTDWLPKARAAGADAAVLDLEDAVPAADKLAARAQVADALARAAAAPPEQPGRMALFVRVNPLDDWAGAEELRAVVRPGLAGIVLPKVRSAQDVRLADRLLGWCEQEQGMPPGRVALVPLLETARGLREAYDIARAASRIAYLGALTAPGGDVERAVGYRWSPEEPKRWHCAPVSCWTPGQPGCRARSADCGRASATCRGCAPSPNRTAPSATRA